VNLHRLVAVALIVLTPMVADIGGAEEILIERPPSHGGWTTTNPPVGPSYRDVTGWFSFGFTFTWDPKPTTATR